MREEKRVIVVDPDEHRLLVKGLNDYRTKLNNEGRPTEDVSELLLKIIDAPTRHERQRSARKSR